MKICEEKLEKFLLDNYKTIKDVPAIRYVFRAGWKAALESALEIMNDFPTVTVDVALLWKELIKQELKK